MVSLLKCCMRKECVRMMQGKGCSPDNWAASALQQGSKLPTHTHTFEVLQEDWAAPRRPHLQQLRRRRQEAEEEAELADFDSE